MLARVYTYNPAGIKRFMVNRVLRIYPAYAASLVLSIVVVYFLPEFTRIVRVDHLMHFPHTVTGWLHNLFIVGINHDKTRLVPDAWFVDIMLVFYLVMALFFRNRKTVFLWFAASVLYTAFMVVCDYPFPRRYEYIQAVSLPVSWGAVLFYLREKTSKLPKWHIVPAVILFFGNATCWDYIWHNSQKEGFYVALVLNGYLLTCLANLSERDFPAWSVKIDRLLGNIAYPMFLCHWQTACLVAWAGLHTITEPRGPDMWFGIMPYVNIVAFLIYILAEANVDRVRKRIRQPPR